MRRFFSAALFRSPFAQVFFAAAISFTQLSGQRRHFLTADCSLSHPYSHLKLWFRIYGVVFNLLNLKHNGK